jgi:hypothetical protein
VLGAVGLGFSSAALLGVVLLPLAGALALAAVHVAVGLHMWRRPVMVLDDAGVSLPRRTGTRAIRWPEVFGIEVRPTYPWGARARWSRRVRLTAGDDKRYTVYLSTDDAERVVARWLARRGLAWPVTPAAPVTPVSALARALEPPVPSPAADPDWPWTPPQRYGR